MLNIRVDLSDQPSDAAADGGKGLGILGLAVGGDGIVQADSRLADLLKHLVLADDVHA